MLYAGRGLPRHLDRNRLSNFFVVQAVLVYSRDTTSTRPTGKLPPCHSRKPRENKTKKKSFGGIWGRAPDASSTTLAVLAHPANASVVPIPDSHQSPGPFLPPLHARPQHFRRISSPLLLVARLSPVSSPVRAAPFVVLYQQHRLTVRTGR